MSFSKPKKNFIVCPDTVCSHVFAAIVYGLTIENRTRFVGNRCNGPLIFPEPQFAGRDVSAVAGAYVSRELVLPEI